MPLRHTARRVAGGSMALYTVTSKREGVIVVYCNGSLVFGEESTAMRSLVKDLLKECPYAVLDLKEVVRIDSGGLGTLVSLFATARNAGGAIKLSGADRRVNELLQMTKLHVLFEVFDKAEEAVASFDKLAKGVSETNRKPGGSAQV
jgi:anti-sigma B factor antagonist